MSRSGAVAAEANARTPLLRLLDDEFADELDGLPSHLWERAIGAPAREFLRRPGKRFRGRLVEAAWALAGGGDDMPPSLPMIVEILHAGSLIVDDIEDGSQVRRDAPTLHRIHGLPQALNTGNWMYFWPIDLVQRLPLPEDRRAALIRRVVDALLRCHRGQALDISLRVSDLAQAEIPPAVRATTRLKTCALFELAAALGAIAAGASTEHTQALVHFARELGAGLQMLDDLGGITSARRRQKGDEDLTLGRPTWPWAWAAAGTGAEVFARLQSELHGVITEGRPTTELAARLRALVAEAGRARVHSRLHLALAVLEDTFGAHPVIDRVASEIERLEKSYG